jgi:hypothetical protein
VAHHSSRCRKRLIPVGTPSLSADRSQALLSLEVTRGTPAGIPVAAIALGSSLLNHPAAAGVAGSAINAVTTVTK